MNAQPRKMNHFSMLTREAQGEAIHRLSRSGMSEYGIAAVTGLAVEYIRRILAPQGTAEGAT